MIAIRPEQSADAAAIRALTQAAFAGHPHSEGAEPAIIDLLRQHGDLSLSLVAEERGEIVGHVAFSPATLSDGSKGWLALGPISVLPARQGEGIGRRLIEEGEKRLRTRGAKGIALLGDPALYARLGFIQETPLRLEGPLAPYFQVLPFTRHIPAAEVGFAPAFAMAAEQGRDEASDR